MEAIPERDEEPSARVVDISDAYFGPVFRVLPPSGNVGRYGCHIFLLTLHTHGACGISVAILMKQVRVCEEDSQSCSDPGSLSGGTRGIRLF